MPLRPLRSMVRYGKVLSASHTLVTTAARWYAWAPAPELLHALRSHICLELGADRNRMKLRISPNLRIGALKVRGSIGLPKGVLSPQKRQRGHEALKAPVI